MKQLILFILLTLTLSCAKNECDDSIEVFEPGEMKYGQASAKKSCKDWQASGLYLASSDSSKFTITMSTTRNGFIHDAFTIRVPSNKVGCYTKFTNVTSSDDTLIRLSYALLDGDAVIMGYKLVEDKDNFFEICNIDTVNKRIQGKFCFYFENEYEPVVDGTPLKVSFTEGTFDVGLFQ